MTDENENDGSASRGPGAFQVTPKEATRAFVLVPWLKSADLKARRDEVKPRSPESRLEEAVGLAAAISLNIVGTAVVPLANPRPATLLGEGKVEELKRQIA